MCALLLSHVNEPDQPQNQEGRRKGFLPDVIFKSVMRPTCPCRHNLSHSGKHPQPRKSLPGRHSSHGPGHAEPGLGELRAQKSALEHRGEGILTRTLAGGLSAWLCLGSSTCPRGGGQGGRKACWTRFPAGPEARTQKPLTYPLHMGFPGGSDSKEPTCNV